MYRQTVISDIEHVLWDWHGVLGVERLWQRPTEHRELVSAFQEQAFTDPARVRAWMRGSTSSEQLLREFGLPLTRGELAAQIYAGWPGQSWINAPLYYGVSGIMPTRMHSIMTDNVDVFSDYLTSDSWIRENFVNVINSADHGCLKSDSQSLLHVSEQLTGIALEATLLIDDSRVNCDRMIELGGHALQVPSWARD